MAQRGRKPIPTAIKELEGNPGKRALNKKEPKPKRKAPKCPMWLDIEAKKRMEKNSKATGAAWNINRGRYGSLCRLLSGVCKMEGSRRIHIKARNNSKNPVRILAAGATGIHRPNLFKNNEQIL